MPKEIEGICETVMSSSVKRQKVILFQNYFTPYRAALFELVGKRYDLTIVYIHHQEDEGRRWKAVKPVNFKVINARYGYLGKFIVFWPRLLERDADCIVLLDNNPSNLAMIVQAVLFSLFVRESVFWCGLNMSLTVSSHF
jgi:hypothetical protein